MQFGLKLISLFRARMYEFVCVQAVSFGFLPLYPCSDSDAPEKEEMATIEMEMKIIKIICQTLEKH